MKPAQARMAPKIRHRGARKAQRRVRPGAAGTIGTISRTGKQAGAELTAAVHSIPVRLRMRGWKLARLMQRFDDTAVMGGVFWMICLDFACAWTHRVGSGLEPEFGGEGLRVDGTFVNIRGALEPRPSGDEARYASESEAQDILRRARSRQVDPDHRLHFDGAGGDLDEA